MRRTASMEWLDDDQGTPEEIERSLDDLWRINRWLGGVSGNLRLLARFFARTGPHQVRILDVGSGDGRLAARLRDELQRRGVTATVFITDRRLRHLDRSPSARSLHPAVADVFALPFADSSFEIVMCNLFFHHFSGERAKEILRRLLAAAREAVLINDLERNLLPYVFIRLAFPFARSPITRHDGPASVRQAYTRVELATLAGASGCAHFETERLPMFRLGMILWKKTGEVNG